MSSTRSTTHHSRWVLFLISSMISTTGGFLTSELSTKGCKIFPLECICIHPNRIIQGFVAHIYNSSSNFSI